ncbi:MAG: hypothetical protein AAFQ36_08765 [Pseudomonadota bacterium]
MADEKALASAKRKALFAIAVVIVIAAVGVYILVTSMGTLDTAPLAVVLGFLAVCAFILSRLIKRLAMISEGVIPDTSAEDAARAQRRAERKRREKERED